MRINAADAAFDRSTISDDTWTVQGTGTTSWSAGTVEKVSTALGTGTAAGTVCLHRDAGAPVSVQAGATLWIQAGAVDAGGATDPFTDTSTGVSVDVKNDSSGSYNRNAGLVVSNDSKQINSLTMTSGANGKTEIADGATLVLKDQGVGNVWDYNNSQYFLNLNTTGTLDLTNNKILVINGSETSLLALVANAYNGGLWDQPGITSSSIGSPDAVGVTDQVATGVLVGYTLIGDASMDLKVSIADLGSLTANYGTLSGATWDMGDFNYDGKVSVADLGGLTANYGAHYAPEPATMGLLALGGLALLRRRRGRSA